MGSGRVPCKGVGELGGSNSGVVPNFLKAMLNTLVALCLRYRVSGNTLIIDLIGVGDCMSWKDFGLLDSIR